MEKTVAAVVNKFVLVPSSRREQESWVTLLNLAHEYDRLVEKQAEDVAALAEKFARYASQLGDRTFSGLSSPFGYALLRDAEKRVGEIDALREAIIAVLSALLPNKEERGVIRAALRGDFPPDPVPATAGGAS